MRTGAILIGLAGAATVIAFAAPLDDHRASVPLAQDISRLETLLATRLSAGLRAPGPPPGLPSGWPASAPDRARPLDQYVRHYALVTLRPEEDLPFSTFEDPPAPGFAGRRIVGVLSSPDILERPAGILISQSGRLPQIFHGGCSVVNVIYDPGAGRLISVWCNTPNL